MSLFVCFQPSGLPCRFYSSWNNVEKLHVLHFFDKQVRKRDRQLLKQESGEYLNGYRREKTAGTVTVLDNPAFAISRYCRQETADSTGMCIRITEKE